MQELVFDMSDESSDESQKNKHKMPPDFDINANIPTLREQFKKIPLVMSFHHLIRRLEEQKAKNDGRTFYFYFILVSLDFCNYNLTLRLCDLQGHRVGLAFYDYYRLSKKEL